MPIDASIPLGVKTPDTMQNLSSLLGIAKGTQEVQNQGISLNERKAVQGVLADPRNYTNDDGTVDFHKALPAIMSVAPTTGMQYVQKLAEGQKAHTEATSALNSLTTENRAHIGSVLAAIPPGTPQDVVEKTVDALGKQYKGMDPLISNFKQSYSHYLQSGGQKAADDFLTQAARGVLPQPTQQDMNSGGVAAVSTNSGTQFVQTKTGAAQPQGSQVGQTLAPPNAVVTTPTGRTGVLNPATGQYEDASAGGPATPPVNFPVGEDAATRADLQAQRTAAQQLANSAPVMHDINRTIVAEASKGLNTGTLGQLTQKVASATGFNLAGESSTGYNLLGKMLERSALTAAQSMGPHTNAGLEASIKANGSLEYTPTAIKKIAYLNDAITSGAELYRDGLEKTIASSQNNIFAKRQFDQEWSKVATPQVLRLKNAVDNKNPEEIASITKEVGGKGSDGARKLHQQLTRLLQLAGQ